MSVGRAWAEIRMERLYWKGQAGYRQGRVKFDYGTRYVDGIVYGLKLAEDIVEKFRERKPPRQKRKRIESNEVK